MESFNFQRFGRNDFEDEQPVRDRWWKIKPGEVVYDVGPAIGSYALPALAMGGRLVAFSGQKDHAVQLFANIAMNPGFKERAAIMPFGCYDQPGWIVLEPSGTRYRFQQDAPEPIGPEDMVVQRLDALSTLAPRLTERIDWIKIDVEGAEEFVLRGAEQLIRRHRPKLLIENHQFMDVRIEQSVIDFIRSLQLGYVVETMPWNSVSHSFFEVK